MSATISSMYRPPSSSENEKIVRDLADLLPETIFEMDLAGNLTYVNRQAFEHFRYSQEDFAGGLNAFAMIHPDDRFRARKNIEAVVRGEKTGPAEYRGLRKDGSTFPVLIRSTPIYREGKPVGLRGIILDYSEQKWLSELNDAIVENTNDGIVVLKEFKPIYLNPRYLDIFGYRHANELLGKSGFGVVHPDDRDAVARRYQKCLDGETTSRGYEFKGICRNGETVYVETSAARALYRGEPVVIAFVRDLADRRRSEEEQRLLSTAIEQSSESVVITDRQGTIQYVNPAFCRISGYEREELLGCNPRILKSGLHDDAFYGALWQTLASADVWRGRFSNRKKDGTLYEEEASITPVRDSGGRTTHYVGVKRDITDEIQMEKRLRQAQKMESIGTLAGGIAHDFNNILFPIIGMAELLLEDLPENGPEHEKTQEILKAGMRGADLVKQILAFSRQSEQKILPIRIQPIFKEVVKLCRSTIPADIRIEHDIRDDCGKVMADPVQVHQVAMNLITNAYHAVEDRQGGIISVELRPTELNDCDLIGTFIVPGPYAMLTVSDTGCGIDPEVMDKIFEPYFTTKEQGKGTGLGLSVVYGIVKEHGGEIRVRSRVGEGTTFAVYFPVLKDQPEPRGDLTLQTHSPEGGTERILLVDDEEAIVRLEKKMLQRLGYRVSERTGSIDALKAFENNPHGFDLVITDLSMPNMTGDHLARKLISIRPDLPVIICTGFSERFNRENAARFGVKAVLMKPIAQSELARTVRNVLDDFRAERRR